MEALLAGIQWFCSEWMWCGSNGQLVIMAIGVGLVVSPRLMPLPRGNRR